MSQTSTRIKQNVKNQVDPDAFRAQQQGTSAPVGSSENPSHRIFTLANLITFCRLVLTLVFFFLYINGENRYLALACYAVAAVTDFLDGQVARRTQTVSWLGKMMDPVMDRLLLFLGVFGLIIARDLPLWIAIFIVCRDSYLFLGGIYLQKYRGRPVDVVYVGKAATACLMTGFTLLLLGIPHVDGLGLVSASWLPGLNGSSSCLGIFFVYAGVLFSALAALEYTCKGAFYVHKARSVGHRIDEVF